MKREIKKIAAVAMALAMTVGSSIPAFAAPSIVMEGTVESLSINMTLPTSGLLTIKPFAGTQIDTGIYYFQNNNVLDQDTEGYTNISYGVSVTKYWAISSDEATAKNDLIKLAGEDGIDADTAGEQKIMAPRIQIGTPMNVEDATDGDNVVFQTGTKKTATASSVEASDAAAATTEQALAFQRGFGKAVVDVPVVELKKETAIKTGSVTTTKGFKYTTDQAIYSTVTDPAVVTIGPDQIAGFRITGNVNTNADWQEGKDGLAIIPVFKITVSTKTNPLTP